MSGVRRTIIEKDPVCTTGNGVLFLCLFSTIWMVDKEDDSCTTDSHERGVMDRDTLFASVSWGHVLFSFVVPWCLFHARYTYASCAWRRVEIARATCPPALFHRECSLKNCLSRVNDAGKASRRHVTASAVDARCKNGRATVVYCTCPVLIHALWMASNASRRLASTTKEVGHSGRFERFRWRVWVHIIKEMCLVLKGDVSCLKN